MQRRRHSSQEMTSGISKASWMGKIISLRQDLMEQNRETGNKDRKSCQVKTQISSGVKTSSLDDREHLRAATWLEVGEDGCLQPHPFPCRLSQRCADEKSISACKTLPIKSGRITYCNASSPCYNNFGRSFCCGCA